MFSIKKLTMPTINLFSQESMLHRKRIILIYGIFSAALMLTILMAQLYFHNLTIQTNKLHNTIKQDKQIIKNTPQFKHNFTNNETSLSISKSTSLYQQQKNTLSILQAISRLTPGTIKLSTLAITNTKLTLAGEATDATPISSYAKKLSQNSSQQPCITNNISITTHSRIHFTLTCPMRKTNADYTQKK